MQRNIFVCDFSNDLRFFYSFDIIIIDYQQNKLIYGYPGQDLHESDNYHKMRKIAIFASGSGTNAENIIKYFSTRETAKVTLVLSNKREAYVFQRAAALKVKSVFFDRERILQQSQSA